MRQRIAFLSQIRLYVCVCFTNGIFLLTYCNSLAIMSLLDGDNLIQSPPSLFQKAKTLRDSKIVYRDRIASAESSPAMVGKTLLSLGNGKEGGSEEGEEEENTGDMDQPGGRGRTMTTNEEEREWEEEEEEQKELNLHASAFMRQRTCRDSKVVTRERSTEGR